MAARLILEHVVTWPNEPTDDELARDAELPPGDEGTAGAPVSGRARSMAPSDGSIAKQQAAAEYYDSLNLGYDQSQRWNLYQNGEGDCSSVCGSIARRAGYDDVDLTGTFYTGNYPTKFREADWQILNFRLPAVRPGDHVVAPGHHVEFAYSATRWFSARNDENGRASGGKTGNQGGRENVGFGRPYDMTLSGTRKAYICRPPDAEIHPGDTGARVAELQAALLKTPYGAPVAASGGADGEYGEGTRIALIAFQGASGLTPDGIVGPKTRVALANALAAPVPIPDPVPVEPPPAPTPDPVPPAPAATKLRVATLNCLDPQIRQGDPAKLHPFTAARCDALMRVLIKAKADFYCLTEAPEVIRDAIRARMPGGAPRWKVWDRGSQAIMFDSKRWGHNTADVVGWGYHGAIVATFTEKRTSEKVSVGVYHLPPDSLVSKVTQQARMEAFAEKARKLPGVRIIGGDGMNEVAWAPGWTDARTAAKASSTRNKATYHTGAITDRILSHGPVNWRGYNVLSAGTGSDHDLVVTALTIGASTSTV